MQVSAVAPGHDGAREREDLLAALAPTYVWWQLEGSPEECQRRVLAQVMNLGTYEDIRSVERLFAAGELTAVMRTAEPGWFSARSWDFWRGRLGLAADLPDIPPQRSFDAKMLRTGA